MYKVRNRLNIFASTSVRTSVPPSNPLLHPWLNLQAGHLFTIGKTAARVSELTASA